MLLNRNIAIIFINTIINGPAIMLAVSLPTFAAVFKTET